MSDALFFMVFLWFIKGEGGIWGSKVILRKAIF